MGVKSYEFWVYFSKTGTASPPFQGRPLLKWVFYYSDPKGQLCLKSSNDLIRQALPGDAALEALAARPSSYTPLVVVGGWVAVDSRRPGPRSSVPTGLQRATWGTARPLSTADHEHHNWWPLLWHDQAQPSNESMNE